MATDVVTYYGVPNSDCGISSFHKIWIMDIANNIVVAGYLGEGTSKEIVSNWETPFADSSLSARFNIVSGLMKELTDKGLQSTINSRQVWAGNQPYTFNLVMKFRAFTNPLNEVELAIRALEMMMAPEPQSDVIMRMPSEISIDLGGMQAITDCCIKSLSVPCDKERNAEGYLIRADVSLQVETRQMLTRTAIEGSFKK